MITLAPDLILHNGQITTLDTSMPQADAVAVKDGLIQAVGLAQDIMPLAGPSTVIIDLQRRRMIPGLADNHIHIIRGGLNYNLELRWDGVRSLADGMAMLKAQVAITPPPQWVRVVGGFTENQFRERRIPTLDELNAVAPEKPVFILHLYDRALINGAALRAVGYTRDTPNPPGGEIQRDAAGNPTGLLLARPDAMVLYATLAAGPRLPPEYQMNSTRHFMRELNRLGVTSACDAGGGFQNYPDDYAIIEALHRQGELTIRIAYNLFTQKPKGELADFTRWSDMLTPRQGDAMYRHNGAGEMLVFSAADFEDFREPRPDLPASMEDELEAVVRHLAGAGWAFRLHATYDETITRALDVYERVHRDQPIDGLHWFIDHAETISDRNIERIGRLGGGIALQHRMAYQGEYFVARYGARAAERTPPLARILEMGVPVSVGTDATRVASYNPWVALSWLVSGRSFSGLTLTPAHNRIDRTTALRLWTEKTTWFTREEGLKGRIAPGKYADLAVLSADYFAIPEDAIADIESVLTILGGRIVHAAGDFASHNAPLPPPMPDWSPVRRFGGYQSRLKAEAVTPQSILGRIAESCACAASCLVHGHDHARSRTNAPTEDAGFWGALGCACWAV